MASAIQEKIAFGKPGIEPRWTRGNKDAVGTAYSASGRLWFTLGFLNNARPTTAQWISAVSGAKMCKNGPI